VLQSEKVDPGWKPLSLRVAAVPVHVRLAVEVKPAGVPFDGTGLLIGPETDTGFPGGSGSAVALSRLVSGLAPGTLYRWRMRTTSESPFFPGSPWIHLPYNAPTEADLRTEEGGTGVASISSAPSRLHLGAAAPNPFTAATELSYALPAAGHIRIAIYDVLGRQAVVLADEHRAAGRYTDRWDGRDRRKARLPAGAYFLRFEFGGQVESRKITLSP